MKQEIELSIVIPVYNSADIFPELYRRLVSTVEQAVNSFEIIAVLDGCKDKSFDVISQYCRSDSRVKLLEFSRNFGHQAAISAGLYNATGKIVAIMDDDLEDPPEVLLQLINKMKEGFDVVYGIRKRRKRLFLHRLMYSLFYRFFSRLVNIKMPHDAGDFCVMKSHIVKVLNNMPETNRYLRGLRWWSGFKQTGIEYERDKRFANVSGYSFKKYFALAFDAMFSFSYKPLRLVSIIGITMALVSFIFGARLIILKLIGRVADVPGWASLMVAIIFFSAVQLIWIGIIGEYIARIYDEVKQRPKYIVMRSIGFGEEDSNVRLGK